MKAVEGWSVTPAEDGPDGARSFLFRDGAPTGLIAPGRVLEACFGGSPGTFLFLTHDIPFEERLDIVLLTGSGSIADQASLWGSLTTGNFRDARATGPDSVEFNFFGGHRWRVRVLSRASFRLPIPGWEPAGVHRPFGWNRRFVIETVP